eukprot:g22876.t1
MRQKALGENTCNLKSSEGLQVTFHGVLIFPPDDHDMYRSDRDRTSKPFLTHKSRTSTHSWTSLEASQKDRLEVHDEDLKERIQDAQEDPTRYVLHVDVSAVLQYAAGSQEEYAARDTSLNSLQMKQRGLLYSLTHSWWLSGGFSVFNHQSQASQTTGFSNGASVKVICRSLEVDQFADAMVASWLPVGDVLDHIQADLSAKSGIDHG